MTPLDLLLYALQAPMPLPPSRPWFSTRDVATLTGRTIETVKGWRTKGLPLRPFGTRGWLYVGREDLGAWLVRNPWALPRREQRLRRLAELVSRDLARTERQAVRAAQQAAERAAQTPRAPTSPAVPAGPVTPPLATSRPPAPSTLARTVLGAIRFPQSQPRGRS